MTKLLLQFLVGIVDAKLLETVHLERLETVDVEHADEAVRFAGRLERLVDLADDPIEQLRVHVFGESVARKQRLTQRQRRVHDLVHCFDALVAQPRAHITLVHFEQLAHDSNRLIVFLHYQ